MAFARKIMNEYNISMSEIDIDDMKKQEVVQNKGIIKRKFKGWEFLLSGAVSKLCSVGVFKRNGYCDSKIVFFGLKEDVDLAEQIYSILRKELLSMARLKGYKGAEQRSYCLGIVHTMLRRLEEEQKKEEKQEQGEKCKAIMVIKNQLVEQYKVKLRLRPGRAARVGNYSAYDRGRMDGHSVNMRPDRNQIE